LKRVVVVGHSEWTKTEVNREEGGKYKLPEEDDFDGVVALKLPLAMKNDTTVLYIRRKRKERYTEAIQNHKRCFPYLQSVGAGPERSLSPAWPILKTCPGSRGGGGFLLLSVSSSSSSPPPSGAREGGVIFSSS
jgi:hypothetical protein